MKYINRFFKKTVIIDAFQFDGTDKSLDSVDWIYERLVSGEVGRTTNQLHIKLENGILTANVGDYIILRVNGTVGCCEPYIFESIYEKVIERGNSNEYKI
jgi:hypothetical protein